MSTKSRVIGVLCCCCTAHHRKNIIKPDAKRNNNNNFRHKPNLFIYRPIFRNTWIFQFGKWKPKRFAYWIRREYNTRALHTHTHIIFILYVYVSHVYNLEASMKRNDSAQRGRWKSNQRTTFTMKSNWSFLSFIII